MDHQSYLEKYNEENSSVVASLTVNKRIFKRLIAFVITSIIYLLIYEISKLKGSHDIQTQFVNTFVNSIMITSYIVSAIFLVCYVLCLVNEKVRNLFDSIKFKTKKAFFFLVDWVVLLPICATVASFCFAFLFTFAQVDGTSMYPTINDESTVFVTYLEEVERYDVVVVYVSSEDNLITETTGENYSEYYIKRIIGLPGDKITWQRGILKINDEIIDETYFSDELKRTFKNNYRNEYEFDGEFSYVENGEIVKVTIIPDGYYFVMGDNRLNSNDSRHIGLIPAKNVEGIAKYEFTDSGIEVIE